MPKELSESWHGDIELELYQESRSENLERLFIELIRKSTVASVIIVMTALDVFAFIDTWTKSISTNYLLHGTMFIMVIATCIALLVFPFYLHRALKNKDEDESNRQIVFSRIKLTLRNFLEETIVILLALLALKYISLATLGFVALLLVLVYSQISEARAMRKHKQDESLSPSTDPIISNTVDTYLKKLNYNITPSVMVTKEEEILLANAWTITGKRELSIVLNKRFIKEEGIDCVRAVLAQEVISTYHKHDDKLRALRLLILLVQFMMLYIVMQNPELAYHLGFAEPSLHASMLIAGLIISPLTIFGTLADNWYSQRLELQADRLAVELLDDPKYLILHLRRWQCLSVEKHRAHPLATLMEDGHPTAGKRISILEEKIYAL